MSAPPPNATSRSTKQRSLQDPYPNTLESVREDIDYWLTREGEGDPELTWEVDVQNRLAHLRNLENRYRDQVGQSSGSESSARELIESAPVQENRVSASGEVNSSSSFPNAVSFESQSTATTRPLSALRKGSFSESTIAVLNKASSLAEESGRLIVSTSCLLFAFAETVGDTKNTCWFVRNTLTRAGNYQREFKRFLNDATKASRGTPIEGLSGRFSANAYATIGKAVEIASRVSHGSQRVSLRHLFAGLLVAPSTPHVPFARKRLESSGLDLQKIADDFLLFIGANVPDEDQEEWRKLLKGEFKAAPSPEPPISTSEELPPNQQPFQPKSNDLFVAGAPGYTSEFCGLGGNRPISDELGVDDLARLLAELIMLRETKLPLAIGLFGNWGSGKSHFMNLIDRHMKQLEARDRDLSGSNANRDASATRWCRHIVPIYFNAWHYSDSNLWASLVTEVFDKLFNDLKPKGRELVLLQQQLRDAGGVTALALEEVKSAAEDVRQATVELQKARDEQEGAKKLVTDLRAGLAENLKVLLPDLDSERERVVDLLGVSTEAATLSELLTKREELRSIAGRSVELWRRATARRGLKTRLTWLAGAMVALVMVRVILPLTLPHLWTLLSGHGPWIKSAFVFLSAATGWMIPAIDQYRKGLAQLENWEKQAEEAQRRLPESRPVVVSKQDLSRAEARAAAAGVALQEAELKEQQLRQALNDLRPERRLCGFIESRARSADYRGQLGLVSLARRDFEELSSIFTDADVLRHKMDNSSAAEAKEFKDLSDSIDRVVLFIDDLDRCEPEKVVDVLQAIHLLLAYPLFAVVVGVDQRCLKQSLRIRFRGLLTPNQGSEEGTEDGLPDLGEIPATPLDYLEKIFHVPFHLPAMSEKGFAQLVGKLVEPAAPIPIALAPAPPGVLPNTENSAGGPSPPAIGEASPQQPGVASIPDGTQAAGDKSAQATKTTDTPPAEALTPKVIGSAPLYSWERKALADFHSLIRTPRGATRFVNTYRLVRAALPSREWDKFRGDEGGQKEFLSAMLLLAVAAGQPAVAREWFRTIRKLKPRQLRDAENAQEPVLEWNQFVELYGRVAGEVTSLTSSEVLAKWLDRVERFTF